jgi:hypothetical protein
VPGAPSDQTIHQLATPFKNPEVGEPEEVEVIDPRHPLFGRRFPLLSRSTSPHSPGQVLVRYRQFMTLRLPRASTTLAPARPNIPTKLTAEAVHALIQLAEDCEVLCPLIQPPSLPTCPPPFKPTSSTISRRSCRR